MLGGKGTDGAQSGSGRDISAIFMELPDRKDIPDYYRTIKNPISLEEIEVCPASALLNGYADDICADKTCRKTVRLMGRIL